MKKGPEKRIEARGMTGLWTSTVQGGSLNIFIFRNNINIYFTSSKMSKLLSYLMKKHMETFLI